MGISLVSAFVEKCGKILLISELLLVDWWIWKSTCECYKLKGNALLIAKVIITFQLVLPLFEKVDDYLSNGIFSYWLRWTLPFISYLLLLAKVIITIHLVTFTLLAKVIITFHFVSPLINKGNHYHSPCIFHLTGKGDYYLSPGILHLIGKGDYYLSPCNTY